MVKQIFVNLPVKDLNKSVEFFTKVGFTFNPQFTDDKAAAMIIGENIFSMLLSESFFKTFTSKDIADAAKTTEAINALSVDSKEEVDELVRRAVEAGGVQHKKVDDNGWMYQSGFQDLDGHLWEIFWMDESKMPKA